MNGCEEFEVAIEMRQHGALGAEEAARLDGHLAACAGCRGYAESVTKTEESMQETAKAAAGNVDWERIRQFVGGYGAATRRKWAMLWIGFALSTILAALASLGAAATGVVVGGLVSALYALRDRDRIREALEAQGSDVALLAFYRGSLGRLARALRISRFIHSLLGAAAIAYFGGHNRLASLNDWLGLAAGIGLLAFGAYVHLRELPRVVRERAELA